MTVLSEAVTILPALDVRRRPSHASELRSQLLMGERVKVLRREKRGGWALVESLEDGYRGWVRTWGLDAVARPPRRRARLAIPYGEVRDRPHGRRVVSPLFMNSTVEPERIRGAWTEVRLPDGRSGWIRSSALRPDRPSRRSLPAILADLWGTPYLWGGRTPLGFDCSGFVQQVLAERGVRLPRDAHDQFLASRRVARTNLRPGDLVFFRGTGDRVGHVGLILGRGRYAHARGMVRANSLDPLNELYDKELGDTIAGFGRPARGG